MAELPIGGCHVPRGDLATVAGSDPEGEGLAHKEGAGLPILPPVPGQSDPWGSGALNQDLLDITRTGHVGHQHQVKVTETVNGEPNPALLSAWNPKKKNKSKR